MLGDTVFIDIELVKNLHIQPASLFGSEEATLIVDGALETAKTFGFAALESRVATFLD